MSEQTAQAEPKKRMPAYCERGMMNLSGKMYLPTMWRLVWFRDDHPKGQINTTILEGGFNEKWVTFRADVYDGEKNLLATGTASETLQGFPKGFVEKCETNAIGRALALAGYGTQFSSEIDEEGGKLADSPVQSQQRPREGGTANQVQQHMAQTGQQHPVANPAPGSQAGVSHTGPTNTPAVWQGPGQCARCHAPEGKRHGKPCIN